MEKTTTRDAQLAARVKKIASKRGVSERYVYMVLRADRHSEDIIKDYMELQEAEDALWQQLMHKQAHQLVPI